MPTDSLHARVTLLLAEIERLLAAHPQDRHVRGEASLGRLWAALNEENALAECVQRMRRILRLE